MLKKNIMKVHFQQNFKDTKNDRCDSFGNLDNMSVSFANTAKLALSLVYIMIVTV